ncbi:polyubiquitin 11-like [Carex rostrata]
MDYDDQSKKVPPGKQSNKRQRTESDDQSKKIFVKMTKTIADQGQRMESGDQSKKNFVKMTKTIAINVTNTDTIDAIKTKVQELEGIAFSKQKLFFCGTRLKGTETVDYRNIQADSCIDLYVKDGITISIQSLDNSNSVSLNVKTSDTVSKIKAMIHDKMGISSYQEISLLFSHKILHDDQTLASCGVCNNAILQMATRRIRTMHITVELFQGPFIEIEVQRWYTISILKHIIGLPQDGPFKLFFSEQELNDNKTLRHHKIHHNAMLQVRSVM